MSETRNPFTVMTVNLRFGLADDCENSWENRKIAFPDLFKQIQPDFIGIQESNNFQTDFLKNVLEGYQFIGMCDPSPDFWQNNIIFYHSSWTCLQNKHYFLSGTPDVKSKFPESKWPRQCTIGLFENSGRRLIHANTHFDFKSSVQEKSAELILDFLNDFPANTPTIITGDFNTPPDSKPYEILSNNGFKDLFENNHSSTFHGFTGKNIGDHIDWILYRGNLKGVNHYIIRESFSGYYPSDHYPVVSVFEFSNTND